MAADTAKPNDDDVADLIAEADTGARNPKDGFSKAMLWWIPLTWSLFQLWIASPLPFLLRFGVLNDTQTRSIHLGFAVFLAFIAFPALKSSPRDRIPYATWAIALVAALTASYLWWDYRGVADRTGAPNNIDLIMAGAGLILLMEAARRSLGFPLMGVALFFLSYVFFGSSSFLPEVVQWKGASFEKAMSHMWLTTEGVFGVALGVSSGFVFLFVLFGSLLNQA
ncbi:MAG: C4-dicarboxylate ABC transporter, partial [Granulosicoccus sp.]